MNAASSQIVLTSQGHVKVINPGQTIDIQCEFETHEFDMFDNPIVWKKYQRAEEKQINIMGNIFEPFLSTRRFEISFTANEPRYMLGLLIASELRVSEPFPVDDETSLSIVLCAENDYSIFLSIPMQK